MEFFRFKPAALRSELEYTISDAGVACQTKDDEMRFEIAWDEIEDAAYVEHRMRDVAMRRIDLILSGNRRRSISATSDRSDPPTDPNAIAFLHFAASVLFRMDKTRPERLVSFGEYGGWKWAMFTVGVIATVAALGLIGLMFAEGLSADRMAAAALPFGLLLLFGIAVSLGNAPWKPVPRLPAKVLAVALEDMASGPTDPEPEAS